MQNIIQFPVSISNQTKPVGSVPSGDAAKIVGLTECVIVVNNSQLYTSDWEVKVGSFPEMQKQASILSERFPENTYKVLALEPRY
jgi:hypothetical protein